MNQEILNGIITGATGGAIAGMILWIIPRLNEWEIKYREEKRIYRWLHEQKNTNKFEWRSTKAIASHNNLTENRVRYLCSYSKRIFQSTGENDVWGVK